MFRALSRGYTHWTSGRLNEIQVNTNHPLFLSCSLQSYTFNEARCRQLAHLYVSEILKQPRVTKMDSSLNWHLDA